MRDLLHRAYKHITRSWGEEPIDRRLRILPPFLIELLGYGIISGIIYYLLFTVRGL